MCRFGVKTQGFLWKRRPFQDQHQKRIRQKRNRILKSYQGFATKSLWSTLKDFFLLRGNQKFKVESKKQRSGAERKK
jgi:hypothetical protein